ncbi:hypothetical protein [Microbacterium sp. gxy059]|uniref:hypothetical protein n=1 Tax=Microbacterium sp. gxy059 TaxID=2957199 RepID=UPI003D965821
MSERLEHECVFAEEQEPSGRLILAPCLVCDYSAMDALNQLRSDVEMWSSTATDLVRDIRALAEDFQANGNSRPLGDSSAAVWHKAASQILKRLDRS